MKIKMKHSTVRTVTKSNRKSWKQVKSIHLSHMHDRAHSWLGTGTSTNSGGIKLALWTLAFLHSEMMWLCKCFFLYVWFKYYHISSIFYINMSIKVTFSKWPFFFSYGLIFFNLFIYLFLFYFILFFFIFFFFWER